MQRLAASLLDHRGYGPRHWDLLLAVGQHCEAWAIFHDGRCRRLLDHRRFYLDYSGPVRKERGMVRCQWRGSAYRCRHGQGVQIYLVGHCWLKLQDGALVGLVACDRIRATWLRKLGILRHKPAARAQR